MEKVKEIIRKKPLLFLVVSVVYALGVGVLKWGIAWPPQAALYFGGAILGVYFLDGAEVFFHLTPSPFRSIVFVAMFALVSLFVVTSSGSYLGSGLVLSLYLSLLLWQLGEWKLVGNLTSWYRMVAGPVSVTTQRWVLVALAAIFLVETYLFIR
ncbi:hypothetical protein A2973_02045 [Candidatus Gottesmanbacteria bacterium RIFCSPLOWO2_01_FULL_49_10]|uniref:Uncharacterized protein n=1 Tax=Candidatus Gottesmanbacteria bacterium RIFCSPLOWO2_01_FULL_49_10 TaxID=1798396 RepID=A0A1F6AWA7_9BACT|nr:MAG: hypothetical protein A2973_02045 [Candidatus Gottesmanbacteria bacterium RIFCSPLOWO2_01_FULL_49_10]